MLGRSALFPFLVQASWAYFSLKDPSDQIGTLEWTSDNAQPTNFSFMPSLTQYIWNVAPNVFDDVVTTLSHKTYSVNKNDSNVVIITNGATATMDYTTVIKFGYNSDLYEASFFGVNAAVLVANASTAYINDINVTVHNGAANIYSTGENTVTYVNNAFLYSSGPVSHGLYASESGTVYGTNIAHYSGGKRASSFSGDAPEGYVHVTNAIAHTDGIGSATCYALGLCNMTNVVGHNSHAPSMFMDGTNEAYWTNCDLTAGLLAGMVSFSAMEISSGAYLLLDHTSLTVLGEDMPGLWYGNIIMDTYIKSSVINNTASGLLVVANFSSVTQDFDHFIGYADNPSLEPAQPSIYVSQSALYGDLVAYNGSIITWSLSDYSSWTGKGYSGYETAYLSVSLDTTSNWTLTGPTTVSNFTDTDTTFSNIFSQGHNIYYDATLAANSYLSNKTIALQGGGKLRPAAGVSRTGQNYWGGYGPKHNQMPKSTPSSWGVTAPGDL